MQAAVRACWRYEIPPDGEYQGVWCGNRVTFHHNREIYWADVNTDIFVSVSACVVSVRDGKVTVETVTGKFWAEKQKKHESV